MRDIDNEQNNSNGANGYLAKNMIVNQGNHMTNNNITHTHNHNNDVIKNKSVIAFVVNIISKMDLSDSEDDSSKPISLPADILKKIHHNNIVKSKYIIETYKIYNIDLRSIYDTLERERPGKKRKLNIQINIFYRKQLSSLGKYDIELLRANSDSILENLVEDLKLEVLKSSNLDADADNVDVYLAVSLIVADAFIECLVLENPEVVK